MLRQTPRAGAWVAKLWLRPLYAQDEQATRATLIGSTPIWQRVVGHSRRVGLHFDTR